MYIYFRIRFYQLLLFLGCNKVLYLCIGINQINAWGQHMAISFWRFGSSLGWEAKFSRTVQVVVTVAVGCRTATSLEFPHQVEGIVSMWFLNSYNHITILKSYNHVVSHLNSCHITMVPKLNGNQPWPLPQWCRAKYY